MEVKSGSRFWRKLGALVGKSGGDEDVPERNELAGRVWHAAVVGGKCARRDPVLEAQIALVAGARVDAYGENDKADDGDDFDGDEPDLHLAKNLGWQHVGGCENNPKDAYPDANVELVVPELDNHS